ncbi:hypothetical protein BGX38DRAFT_1157238 [Terfezia claveryi]|nr:hypothetical protein BGX38DRAFT_1157238 [Terfezia claveryi]
MVHTLNFTMPHALLPLSQVSLTGFLTSSFTNLEPSRWKTATAKKGRFVGIRPENITAPSDANTGVAPNAFGAVDWLKLVSTDNVRTASGRVFASKGYKTIYRVETAGGRPPATCQGRPTHFEISYAAQYWLHN